MCSCVYVKNITVSFIDRNINYFSLLSTSLSLYANPCSFCHLSSHPGNHGYCSSVFTSHSLSTTPFASCILSISSKAGITTCSTAFVHLYSINPSSFPSLRILERREGM